MNTIKAIFGRRSGFSDVTIPRVEVTILGFVFGSYEPGYKSSGSKECILAVIAQQDGSITQAELRDLTYIGTPSLSDAASAE